MKLPKLISFFSVILLYTSCNKEVKDYAIISGRIHNHVLDSLKITKSGVYKTLYIQNDGTFTDTIKPVEEGLYTIFYENHIINMNLKSGIESEIYIDLNEGVEKSVFFKGDMAEFNSYLIEVESRIKKLARNNELFKSEENEFNTALDSFLENEMDILQSFDKVDSSVIASQKKTLNVHVKSWKENYQTVNAPLRMNGKPAPNFTYTNHSGGSTSLSDLRGKYVYIDLWATWCGPCIEIMPYLEKTQEKYKNKDIEFVSVSVDRLEDGDKWKKFVAQKKLKGIQLWAKGDSTITKAYSVNGIPKFILIDKNGNTLKTNAPYPVVDDEEYKAFDELMATLDI